MSSSTDMQISQIRAQHPEEKKCTHVKYADSDSVKSEDAENADRTEECVENGSIIDNCCKYEGSRDYDDEIMNDVYRAVAVPQDCDQGRITDKVPRSDVDNEFDPDYQLSSESSDDLDDDETEVSFDDESKKPAISHGRGKTLKKRGYQMRLDFLRHPESFNTFASIYIKHGLFQKSLGSNEKRWEAAMNEFYDDLNMNVMYVRKQTRGFIKHFNSALKMYISSLSPVVSQDKTETDFICRNIQYLMDNSGLFDKSVPQEKERSIDKSQLKKQAESIATEQSNENDINVNTRSKAHRKNAVTGKRSNPKDSAENANKNNPKKKITSGKRSSQSVAEDNAENIENNILKNSTAPGKQNKRKRADDNAEKDTDDVDEKKCLPFKKCKQSTMCEKGENCDEFQKEKVSPRAEEVKKYEYNGPLCGLPLTPEVENLLEQKELAEQHKKDVTDEYQAAKKNLEEAQKRMLAAEDGYKNIEEETQQTIERIALELLKFPCKWRETFDKLKEYKEKNGDFIIRGSGKDAKQLKDFCAFQRRQYAMTRETSKLPWFRIIALEKIGFPWKSHADTWQRRYQDLLKYKEMFGNCLVPRSYKAIPKLADWVKRQRDLYSRYTKDPNTSPMTEEHIRKLEDIGFVWTNLSRSWNDRFDDLVNFRKVHGHCLVPANFAENPKLSQWVANQRAQYTLFMNGKKSFLSTERVQTLESLGFVWSMKTHPKKTGNSRNPRTVPKQTALAQNQSCVPRETAASPETVVVNTSRPDSVEPCPELPVPIW